jgi:hypothetical protein
MSSKPARYIVSPGYDWAFFLLPPVAALWLGVAISGTVFTDLSFRLAGDETTGAALLIGTVVHAHLVAVFFRSHNNPAIFRLYPLRFILVPIVLWLAIVSSMWLAITATVVATFWDVWHSGAQTFGFARIYDRNHGNPPELARKLDFWANQLLYAGPILAGATLVDHVDSFDNYEAVGSALLTRVPAYVQSNQRYLTWAILAAGTVFLIVYVYTHWLLHRRGRWVSPLKVYLVASTGLCSIYTWGFNSWGEAFFIMNLFHAVQYLALVWAMEKRRIMSRLRVSEGPRGKLVALALFLGAVFAYGLGAELLDADFRTLWAITIVVSLMHFWYDGFIWSVGKKQV